MIPSDLYRLHNLSQSDVTRLVPLPSVPVIFGGHSQHLSLRDGGLPYTQQELQAAAADGPLLQQVTDLLRQSDISYLALRKPRTARSASPLPGGSDLREAILSAEPTAFAAFLTGHPPPTYSGELQAITPGAPSDDALAQHLRGLFNAHKGGTARPDVVQGAGSGTTQSEPLRVDDFYVQKKPRSAAVRKPFSKPVAAPELHGSVEDSFCRLLDNLFAKVDTVDEQQLWDFCDLRSLHDAVVVAASKDKLAEVPLEHLSRLVETLEKQVEFGQGTQLSEEDDVRSPEYQSVTLALEACQVIDTLVEVVRFHMTHNIFPAFDPSFRPINTRSALENQEGPEGADANDTAGKAVAVGKKRKSLSNAALQPRRSTGRISAVAVNIMHKLRTLLGMLAQLVTLQRLPDSTVLQLCSSAVATLPVEGIQLLQLKAMSLVCGVFSEYPDHRLIIMDSLLSTLWKLPTAKRGLRLYALPEDDSTSHIQVFVALLLQCIQAAVSIPTSGATDDQAEGWWEPALELSKYFWMHVLQKWAGGKSQETDPKCVTENILTDLLLVMNMPEWPAASVVLQVFCSLLLGPPGLQSSDGAVRLLAIEFVGLVAARLKADSVLAVSDGTAVLATDSDEPAMRTFWAGWKAQRLAAAKQTVALSRGTLSAPIADGQQQESTLHKADASVVCRQIIINYLTDAMHKESDSNALYARRFFISQTCKDIGVADSWKWLAAQWEVPPRTTSDLDTPMPRRVAVSVVRVLAQQRPLARSFDRLLDQLLGRMFEGQSTPRARALKAVCAIVEADPNVLGEERVQRAVEARFLDNSISVRDAAMELVGKHIVANPSFALQYYDRVAERIMDTGVSVRKRVTKILRDICLGQPDFPKAIDACTRVIQRISDNEPQLQDLVAKTFHQMWFESSQPDLNANSASNIASNLAAARVLEQKTQQLVAVLSGLPTNAPLVSVISRSLALDKSASDTTSSSPVRQRCERMCACLIELILKVEENSTEGVEARMLPYMSALHAFCAADPSLCVPERDPCQYASTLLPYLKSTATTKEAAQLLQSLISVLDAVFPLVQRPPAALAEGVAQALRTLILRQSYLFTVHAAVKCLCTLAKLEAIPSAPVLGLSQRFYGVLHDGQSAALNATLKAHVLRSLFVLGHFCRYYADAIDAAASTVENGVSIEQVLQVYQHYMLLGEFDIQQRALQGCGFIMIARPKLLLLPSIEKLVVAKIDEGSDPRLKTQMLRNFCDFLQEDEARMGGAIDLAEEKSKSKSIRKAPTDEALLVAAGAGDTSASSGVVQLYWQYILQALTHCVVDVRSMALKVVELVLRQGLVHPMTCISRLVSLVVDPEEQIRKSAHHILEKLHEKYPTFLEAQLGDGLQLSFGLCRALCAQANGQAVHEPAQIPMTLELKEGFSRLYKLMRVSRASRNKFISALLQKFEEPPSQNNGGLIFALYLVSIAAFLPFTLLDEPLYIVYTINRIVTLKGSSLLSSLKMFFGKSEHEAPVHNGSTGNSRIPLPPQVQRDCDHVVALSLLLLLKQHIKICYGLTDGRCQQYSPSEAMRPGETVTSFHQQRAFDTSQLPLTGDTSSFEFYRQRHQVFKQLMKEDAINDFNLAPAKRKEKGSAAPNPNGVGAAPVRKQIRQTPNSGRKKPHSRSLTVNGSSDDAMPEGADRERTGAVKPRKRKLTL
eukprot:jgi/Chlat1/1211/Chrsp115S01676